MVDWKALKRVYSRVVSLAKWMAESWVQTMAGLKVGKWAPLRAVSKVEETVGLSVVMMVGQWAV